MAGNPINKQGYNNYQCSCGDYLETGAMGAPNAPGKQHNPGDTGEKCNKCGETGYTGPSGFTKGTEQWTPASGFSTA